MAADNSKLGGLRSEVGVVRMSRHQTMVWGSGGLLSDFFFFLEESPLNRLDVKPCSLDSSCARSSVPYQHQLFVMTQPEMSAAFCGSQLEIAATSVASTSVF